MISPDLLIFYNYLFFRQSYTIHLSYVIFGSYWQRASVRRCCCGYVEVEQNLENHSKYICFYFAIVASATPPSTTRRQSTNTDQVDTKLTLPKAAYYVIFVEGCERFCFYGLKTILLLYFMNYLRLSKDTATSYYHLFSFACYFTPTIGAIISDGYIGRYSTVLYLSIVYLIGSIILTLTAIPSISHQHL